MSPYKTPQITRCGLNIDKQTLSQSEALQQWQDLMSQGYEGWVQCASAVLRSNATTQLTQEHGGLIAGECYQGKVSYKLQQVGRQWSLSRFERTEGNQYHVIERQFFGVEPQAPQQLGLVNHHQPVSYEVFWPSHQNDRYHQLLSHKSCEQIRPICARLTSL